MPWPPLRAGLTASCRLLSMRPGRMVVSTRRCTVVIRADCLAARKRRRALWWMDSGCLRASRNRCGSCGGVASRCGRSRERWAVTSRRCVATCRRRAGGDQRRGSARRRVCRLVSVRRSRVASRAATRAARSPRAWVAATRRFRESSRATVGARFTALRTPTALRGNEPVGPSRRSLQ